MWAVDGGAFDQQMHMIRHNFHRFDGDADFGSLFGQQFSQPDLNVVYQHLAAVLGTPNEMVAEIVDGFIAGSPSLIAHTFYYAPDKCMLQILSDKCSEQSGLQPCRRPEFKTGKVFSPQTVSHGNPSIALRAGPLIAKEVVFGHCTGAGFFSK